MKSYTLKNSTIEIVSLIVCIALLSIGQAYSQVGNKGIKEVLVKGVNINELKAIYYVELVALADVPLAKLPLKLIMDRVVQKST